MQVTVNRLTQTKDDTISAVEINGRLKYYGLEILKCIPPGTYPLTRYFSPDHNFYVPLVNNVPGFEGIELHIANTVKDVKGCLGLADNIESLEDITNSWVAVTEFYTAFFADCADGIESTITYVDLF